MSCCGQNTAKTGRVIHAATMAFTAPAGALGIGKCITDKFIIDCATVYPESSSRIEQVDIIEKIESSGAKAKPLCKLFISRNDFAAQSAGSVFSVAVSDDDLADIAAMANLSAQWIDIDATKAVQSSKGIDINFTSGAGRAIYGQLVAAGDYSFSDNTKLLIRIFIRKD